MSNQVILWSMLIVPWLTLFFMSREEIKRYMPVAISAAVTSVIIYDTGITLGLWTVGETVFPFHQLGSFLFGLMPVLTMWVIKFTYGRFGLYMVTNLILDIGFNFFFLNYFLPSRGILYLLVPPIQTLPITLIHAIVLYGYQIWQEGVFARSERTNFLPDLQPAAAKPLDHDQDDNKDNR